MNNFPPREARMSACTTRGLKKVGARWNLRGMYRIKEVLYKAVYA